MVYACKFNYPTTLIFIMGVAQLHVAHFCAEMFLVTAVLLSPFLLVAQSADEVNATVYYDG